MALSSGWLQGSFAASVTQAEVRIDGGPSVPMTLAGAITNPAFQEFDFTLTLPTTNLSVGSHFLETRLQSDNGVWSAWRSQWFRVAGNPTLTGAEWYLDNDPGPGNGTPIALPADGAWDEPEEDIRAGFEMGSGVATGRHELFLRTKDSDGNWGTPNRTTFYVADPVRIVAAEWTTNALAEPGTGFPMAAADGAFDGPNEDLVVVALGDLLQPADQTHTIYVRAKDSLGRWSTRKGLYYDETTATWSFDPTAGWGETRRPEVRLVEGPVDELALNLRDQPVSQRVPLDASITLRVGALAQLPLTYQWLLNGQSLTNQTNATLAIAQVRIADGGTYTVQVSNGRGTTVTSDPALLEIELGPLPLTDRFADRTVVVTASGVGTTNNLAATANEPGERPHAGKRGGKSLWMTWRAPANGRAVFATSGSSFDTLLAVYTGNSLAALSEFASDEDSGGFLTSRVEFQATGGTEYQIAVDGFAGVSGTIVLQWNLDPSKPALPRIVVAPQPRTVPVGGQADFSVQAEGDGLTYRWLLNGVPLPGETASTLRRGTVNRDHVGLYAVRVTNSDNQTRETPGVLLEVVTASETAVARDKLEDLFPEDLAGRAALHAPGGPAWTSISVGVIDARETDNRGAQRSPGDPVILDEVGGASLWFRLRVTEEGYLSLSTEGSEIPTVLGVYVDRSALTELAVGKPDRNQSFGTVTVPVEPGVDYLVMVYGVGEARGRIRLTGSLPVKDVEPDRPRVKFHAGGFGIRQAVRPGWYELESGEDIFGLAPLVSTNVTGGMFEFSDPRPPSASVRFYHLKRVR